MVSRVRNVVVVVVVVLTSTRIIKSVVTGQAPVVITVFVCCFSHSYIQASGQAVVTGVVPSFSRFSSSFFSPTRYQVVK